MAQPPTPPPSARAATVSARLKLTVGDLAIETAITVPQAPAPATAVLPALRGLVDTVVASAEARERRDGRTISCRKGCSACCRQLVPISHTEADAIRALLDAMPPPRRKVMRQRFAAAAARLRTAGLAAALLDPAQRAGRTTREMGAAYFALNLDCPFLEDDLCSIHPDRPLVCREYLVTSPASHCSLPEQEGVDPVRAPKLSVAARGLENVSPERDATADWLPLALALESPTQSGRKRTGPEWIKRFFAAMQGQPQRRSDQGQTGHGDGGPSGRE